MPPEREHAGDAGERVAAAAEREPAWAGYAQYCRTRRRGLRRDALRHLDAWLADAERWPFERRRDFAGWLCDEAARARHDRFDYSPHPLTQRLLLPTLVEWTEREPSSPLPHRWLGMFFGGYSGYGVNVGKLWPPLGPQDHLRRALALDPDDQASRVRLAELLIRALDFDAHHLPEYYIGDPEADVMLADEAAQVVEGVSDAATRDALQGALAATTQLLDDWIAFKLEGGPSFDEWCRAQGRQYTWNVHYYYDDGRAGAEAAEE